MQSANVGAMEVLRLESDGGDGCICLAVDCLLGGAYSGDGDQ